MRPALPLLLALPLFAACAATPSPPSAPAGRDLPADRRPDDFAAALARVRAQEPGRAARDAGARHIDQHEPPAPGAGPRRFAGSLRPIRAFVAGGAGTVKVAGPLADRAPAAFVQIGLDGSASSPRGASLHARAFASDGDLFAGRMINDGLAPARAQAEVRGADVFPHVRLELLDGETWRLPLRAGLFADVLEIDHDAGVSRSWLSVGARAACEPALRLFGDAERRLELCGRFGGEVGPAWFAESHRGGADHDQALRFGAHGGAGLRLWWGRAQFELGWQIDQTWFGTTATDLYGRHGTDVQRQAVMLGGSVAF